LKTIHGAQQLKKRMTESGHTVSLIHGGKETTPQERDKTIDDFRKGLTKVLISSNVLARGIDILQVSLVINYDIPAEGLKADPETYIHRIGRSGRFGREGIAINFVHDAQSKEQLKYISDYYHKQIKELSISQLEELPKMLRKLALPGV
jgi:ATP-dependent RNA helicase DDX19/DBP5